MLIHLYSISYLESDRGYARYFSYLNFFVFSMLLLVLAGNFVLGTVAGDTAPAPRRATTVLTGR